MRKNHILPDIKAYDLFSSLDQQIDGSISCIYRLHVLHLSNLLYALLTLYINVIRTGFVSIDISRLRYPLLGIQLIQNDIKELSWLFLDQSMTICSQTIGQ